MSNWTVLIREWKYILYNVRIKYILALCPDSVNYRAVKQMVGESNSESRVGTPPSIQNQAV